MLGDITQQVDALVHYLASEDQVGMSNQKNIIPTVESGKCVLAIKNSLFDKAGVPHFISEVKQAGYKPGASRNTR